MTRMITLKRVPCWHCADGGAWSGEKFSKAWSSRPYRNVQRNFEAKKESKESCRSPGYLTHSYITKPIAESVEPFRSASLLLIWFANDALIVWLYCVLFGSHRTSVAVFCLKGSRCECLASQGAKNHIAVYIYVYTIAEETSKFDHWTQSKAKYTSSSPNRFPL